MGKSFSQLNIGGDTKISNLILNSSREKKSGNFSGPLMKGIRIQAKNRGDNHMTLFLVYMVTLAEFCFAHNYLEAGWYSTWAKLLACVVQEVRAAYYFFIPCQRKQERIFLLILTAFCELHCDICNFNRLQ